MKQLSSQPASANERALASEYRETITGVTGTTFALAHLPRLTVDGVGLELIFKNGVLLDGGGARLESFTGTGLGSVVLAQSPSVGTVRVYVNGVLLDPAHGTSVLAIATDTISGVTGTTLTLAFTPVANTERVTKNGTVLVPGTGYTISGATITLAVAAVSGDTFVITYNFGRAMSYAVSGHTVTLTMDATGTPDVVTVAYMGSGDTPGYTISGQTVTLAVAAVATDSYVALYPYRQ